jgi:four helix bundle protein
MRLIDAAIADDRRIFRFVHDYRRLIVWQRARTLGVDIHVASRSFPRSDRGVVASQLRRSALSISAKVAEGCGKTSRRETIRFLEIASGSAKETEHHLLVAGDLGFLARETNSHRPPSLFSECCEA